MGQKNGEKNKKSCSGGNLYEQAIRRFRSATERGIRKAVSSSHAVIPSHASFPELPGATLAEQQGAAFGSATLPKHNPDQCPFCHCGPRRRLAAAIRHAGA
jgi:hypothetical protein